MEKGKSDRGRNILKFVCLMLLLNLCLGSLVYFELTDREKVAPVRGLSMTHDGARFGVIDQADSLLVKPYDGIESIVTAREGSRRGDISCGFWGDVIVFEPNGNDSTRICHRVLFYLEFNLTVAMVNDIDSVKIDVPEIGLYGADSVYVYSVSNSYELKVDKLIAPFLFDSRLTPESLAELEFGSGYVTMGDHNSKVDQERLKPVKYEWILGRAEVIDNPFGVHDVQSMYLLSVFIIMFLGINLWSYRRIFEKDENVNMRMFNFFYLLMIVVYSSGFFVQLIRTRNDVFSFVSIIFYVLSGLGITMVWMWFVRWKRTSINPVRKENTLRNFLTSRRHWRIFQSMAGLLIAYGFMKFGLYTISESVIFVILMVTFYRLSIPIYFKNEIAEKRTGSPGGVTEKVKKREYKLLDWMIISLLLIFIALLHLIEGLGFISLLAVTAVFGNLMFLNCSMDFSA